MPTTTPIMIRFWDDWRPELPLEPLLPSSVGALVDVEEEVDTATRPLVVETKVTVLLPLIVTTVVTSCSVLLLTDVKTEPVGLFEAKDVESVDMAPGVVDPDVEDSEDCVVVEEGWELKDGTMDEAEVVVPELLFELDVSGADELEVVVGAGEDVEEPEVAVVLPDDVGVEAAETPVLRTPICRR